MSMSTMPPGSPKKASDAPGVGGSYEPLDKGLG